MDILGVLRSTGGGLSGPVARNFATEWRASLASKGSSLIRQEEFEPREALVLDGRAISIVGDGDGRNVCIGFHIAPCVLPPNVARTRDGASRVTIEMTTDATVSVMAADRLVELMVEDDAIRDWGNIILREVLSEKADREWCLAALGGRDRLSWFRDRYPSHETMFAHGHIASFLGMTPVTLSRLRSGS